VRHKFKEPKYVCRARLTQLQDGLDGGSMQELKKSEAVETHYKMWTKQSLHFKSQPCFSPPSSYTSFQVWQCFASFSSYTAMEDTKENISVKPVLALIHSMY